MKTTAKLLAFVLVFALCANVSSQESNEEKAEDFKPVYITMTTTHWNDDPDTDFSDWLETEKEYFEKVVKKNDLIMSSGVYTHYFTPDNSEIVMVNVYENWSDIENANEINQKLIEEAWPDEKDRQAFFKKQRSYYRPDHKDEIYLSMPFMIPESQDSQESKIFYVRSSDLAMNGNGKPGKFKEHFEKVTKKSKKLKGYYTHRHLWGSNGREMTEVFVFDKLADIEDFFDEEENIIKATWTDEKERTAFMQDLGSNFTGKHADYVYRSVPELQK
ncbi:hypothetical protein [Christiangramia crocea]|uniref:Antibiotic biosynthesis monooxygenase n=1 Tax=Christiangramia crocea TaxID=2904124 RepID=A0A9X1UTS3_9FLAO|nr:hypothetical protein [Gramella crocea]MCG9970089.1 hypothetical protein [Gramella crocea]